MNWDFEPVKVAEAVRAVLMALVAVGWLAFDDATVGLIVTAVTAVLSVVLSLKVRDKVTPVD